MKDINHYLQYPKHARLLMFDMDLVRELAKVGHKERKRQGIPIRQPLKSITFTIPNKWVEVRNKIAKMI